MKRYLICTLLVINAVPVQAFDWITTTMGVGAGTMVGLIYIKKQQDESEEAKAQFEWCKDKPGCETFTYACNEIAKFGKTVEDAVVGVAQRTQEIEPAHLSPDSDLVKLIKTTTVNTVASINHEIKKRSDLIDPQQMSKWADLMEGCQRGDQAQCEELTKYSEAIAQRAPEVGQQNKKLGELKVGLVESEASIINAKNIEELAAATQKYNTILKEFDAIKNANDDVSHEASVQ